MPKLEAGYIPVDEASAYLSVDKKTIRRMIARGELTGYRAGPRLIRVDARQLDAILRPIPTAGGGRHGPDAA